MSNLKLKNRAGYEDDFFAWLNEQAAAVRAGDLGSIDSENVAEELEGMAKSQKHALASHLRTVLLHMIKMQFQPHRQSRSWIMSVENGRDEIRRLLEDSPSLRPQLADAFVKEFPSARRYAAVQMRTGLRELPDDPTFTLEQVLGSEPFAAEEECRQRLGIDLSE